MKILNLIYTTVIILLVFCIFITCKRILPTEKPLYDVLADKNWEEMINTSETGRNFRKLCSNGELIIDTKCQVEKSYHYFHKWEINNTNKIIWIYKWFTGIDTVVMKVEKYSETIIKGIIESSSFEAEEGKDFKLKLCE